MVQNLEKGITSLSTAVEVADADLALMYLRHLYRLLVAEQAIEPGH